MAMTPICKLDPPKNAAKGPPPKFVQGVRVRGVDNSVLCNPGPHNLRVGVKVLQECIARAGSVEGGLKYYVGAANLPTDGGYAEKVMAEHARLYQVAKGKPLPSQPPLRATTTPAPAPGSPPVKVAALS